MGRHKKYANDIVMRVCQNESKSQFIKRSMKHYLKLHDEEIAMQISEEIWFNSYDKYRNDDRFIMNAF